MSKFSVLKLYTLYLIAARGSKAGSPVQTFESENDAQALGEACKVFGRLPDVDSVELWQAGRWVVNLGGRPIASPFVFS